MKKFKKYFKCWTEIVLEIEKKKSSVQKTSAHMLYVLFLNKMNDEDLFEFMEDALSGGSPEVNRIFSEMSGAHRDISTVIFDFLSNTPIIFIKSRLTPVFDKIFSKALDNKYADEKNILVIRNIKALTVLNKVGLSEDKIINTVTLRPDVPVPILIELLHLLSKLENGIADYSFWIRQSEKFDRQPYMAAGFIEALKKNHPEELFVYCSSLMT